MQETFPRSSPGAAGTRRPEDARRLRGRQGPTSAQRRIHRAHEADGHRAQEQRPAWQAGERGKAPALAQLDATLSASPTRDHRQLGPAIDRRCRRRRPGPRALHTHSRSCARKLCRILAGGFPSSRTGVETEYYFSTRSTRRPITRRACAGHVLFPREGPLRNLAKKTRREVSPAHAHLVGADSHHVEGRAADPRRVSGPRVPPRHFRRHPQRNFAPARMPYVIRTSRWRDLRRCSTTSSRRSLAGHRHALPAALFRYTEPSFEVDLSRSTSQVNKPWIEIGGCGMVESARLRGRGLRSQVWSGYAFGMASSAWRC